MVDCLFQDVDAAAVDAAAADAVAAEAINAARTGTIDTDIVPIVVVVHRTVVQMNGNILMLART